MAVAVGTGGSREAVREQRNWSSPRGRDDAHSRIEGARRDVAGIEALDFPMSGTAARDPTYSVMTGALNGGYGWARVFPWSNSLTSLQIR
jgi:hypothetical protein